MVLNLSCCSALLHLHSASHPEAFHRMSWNKWLQPAKLSKQGKEQQNAEPKIPEMQSCGYENPQESHGPECGISRAGLGRIIFPGNTGKTRSGISSHIYIFRLFHGTKMGLKFNLLLLLWFFHQHFTRLLKSPWNFYFTWDNCVIYCLRIFYLLILENNLFIGLYFSTPVVLWIGMCSPGWRLLGNKPEKILKTLVPSSALSRVGPWAFPAGRKRLLSHNTLILPLPWQIRILELSQSFSTRKLTNQRKRFKANW